MIFTNYLGVIYSIRFVAVGIIATRCRSSNPAEIQSDAWAKHSCTFILLLINFK